MLIVYLTFHVTPVLIGRVVEVGAEGTSRGVGSVHGGDV